MDDQKKDPETKSPVSEGNNPTEAGKKAIEANNAINDSDKSPEEIEKIEKKDAEAWRNEG